MGLKSWDNFMGFFKRKKKKRACVIGLDGVPYPLLKDFAQRGVMSHMDGLIAGGHLHQMKASLPEISSVSWTDFMTGTNPGTHGIFGFTDLKPQTYDLRFPNYLDVKSETFWDRLGRDKKSSVIINQPSTYPARPLRGKMISGFVAIDMAKAVYPLSLKPELEKLGYDIDIDTFKARDDHELLWKELARTLAGREQAFLKYWEEEWDYFEIVITGTDRLQHFLWDAYPDESHPYHTNFLDYYRAVDGLIGKVIAAYRELTDGDDGLFLLSDHGFTGIKQEVYLNTWLKQEGYLDFASPEPKDLNDLTPETRAFVMDPNRLYLHSKDRFPRGCVDLTEKSDLKAELKQKLEELEYDGEKVVDTVWDTEKIYSGPLISQGPDLIILSRHGFDMKGSVKKKEVFGRTNLQGMHTWDDAFFWSVSDHGQGLHISQLADIILQSYQ
jgi:predicted AlkP superfamily phosphohydrolase/phosphomutase